LESRSERDQVAAKFVSAMTLRSKPTRIVERGGGICPILFARDVTVGPDVALLYGVPLLQAPALLNGVPLLYAPALLNGMELPNSVPLLW
jgi:hypothetical protein